jgi:glyoxylase-like metal-dependent hydrolase (beta-lactamase superfamily II)
LVGATLHLPEQDRVVYPYEPVRDSDVFEIGSARLTALHTPGHTLESVSYLLDQRALFTGDTLFLESVGRPDLEASPDEARERARLLYRSLTRLSGLDAQTIVLPGHTSAPIAFDQGPVHGTLADVRARITLLHQSEDEFVSAILGRIPPTPPNHHLIVELNEAGLRLGRGDETELEAGANRCAVA